MRFCSFAKLFTKKRIVCFLYDELTNEDLHTVGDLCNASNNKDLLSYDITHIDCCYSDSFKIYVKPSDSDCSQEDVFFDELLEMCGRMDIRANKLLYLRPHTKIHHLDIIKYQVIEVV